MYVFIKTPLYKNTKYTSHIVEHCILSNVYKYDEYLNKLYNSRWVSFCWYTKFYFPTKNKNKAIKQLTNSIDKNKINTESKIILDEIKTWNYTQWLLEIIWKKIYWKNFVNNWKSKVRSKEIIDYHKKYYKEDKFFICNDNYNLISKDIKKNNWIKKEQNIKSFKIIYKKTNFKVFYVKYKSFKDFYKFKFIEILVNSMLTYYYSKIDLKYYFEYELLDILWEYLILTIPQNIWLKLSEENFKSFKKYFLKTLNQKNNKEWKIISTLLIWENINNENILTFINKLTLSKIKNFLK